MTVDGCKKILVADAVVPVGGPPLSPGFVVIEAGRIVDVGPGRRSGREVDDFGPAIILPAFVNAHTHLGCAFLKGCAPDASFFEWMTSDIAPRVIAAVRDTPESIERHAHGAVRELVEGGVGTIGESFFHYAGRRAMNAAGLRGTFFREYFGSMSADLQSYVAAAEAEIAIEAASVDPSHRVSFGLAPHAPYTCPRDALAAMARCARRHRLRSTIHVAESAEELACFARSEGPMFERFAAGDRGERYDLGITPLEAVHRSGLLGPETLVVHAVHLEPSDIEVLARTGTHVVHCPGSNLRLGVGAAPIAELRAAGVNIALGTDSAASNGKLDMFEEMRLAMLVHRSRPGKRERFVAADVLEMATIAGARALGVESEIGTLTPGKAADLCVVDVSEPRHLPFTDPVHALVWSSTPADVLTTWVAGQPIFDRSRP